MENKNFQVIPDDVKNQVNTLLKQVDTLLTPYCVTLTNTERKEISKMGHHTISFVEKAFEIAQQHSEFLPSYVDIEQWRIDMLDVNSTDQIEIALNSINEKVSDTRMEAGHEALQAALAFYHNLQRAASDGVPAAKPAYDALKIQFKNRGARANKK